MKTVKNVLYFPLLLLCLLSFSPQLLADSATVVALQAEAWVHRGDNSYPLKQHAQLTAGDQIRTGKQARVILRLSDDSTVKLGEYAIVNVDNLLSEAENDGVFKATLNVIRGAFRFTSEKQAKRDVSIKVGRSITAGVRGTDLWGQAEVKDQSLVCLIEGKIEVSSGDTRVVLKDPRDFFVVPNGKDPLPVGKLEEEKLKKWAQSTELQAQPH